MRTFRDFLVWYNNLDVEPFVEAVENFQQFYFEQGIDVFKTAISVPGIPRPLLFRTGRKENANFALFDKQNEDLYQTIKHNIVGGPSIIFPRHHCAGQTRIRGNKRQCGAILGFDANALYLQAISQPMPVGPFVRRLADNDFRPESRDKYMSTYYWMDWLAYAHGVFPFITFHHGLPSEENLNSLSDETICNLVVLDDLMKTVTSSGEMANLFVKGMHHRHLSILFLNQNLYCKGKHSRTINFSCSVWHVKRFWEEEDFYLMRIRTRLHKRTDIWS